MKFDIFVHSKPGVLLTHFIQAQPNKGRGLGKKLADSLGVASPQVSQYVTGAKVPSVDHGVLIAQFFSWGNRETEYWLALIEYERAGHHLTRNFFRQRLIQMKEDSLKLAKAVEGRTELEDKQKATFYSSWLYSAIRLCCSLGNGKTLDEIHQLFSELSLDEIKNLCDFLLNNKLIVQNGLRYEMGTQHTWVPKGSPFLNQHHRNWRVRAMERAPLITDEEIMVTAPMSISKTGFRSIRRDLQNYIKSLLDRIPEHGDAEDVVCLNVDFFRVIGRKFD